MANPPNHAATSLPPIMVHGVDTRHADVVENDLTLVQATRHALHILRIHDESAILAAAANMGSSFGRPHPGLTRTSTTTSACEFLPQHDPGASHFSRSPRGSLSEVGEHPLAFSVPAAIDLNATHVVGESTRTQRSMIGRSRQPTILMPESCSTTR
ncbi:hypothetical protein ZWY2020_006184 [Hordeum vulgare]|nr:hypothetical protein ZWY2020_006184 [Hordeum vulgare]